LSFNCRKRTGRTTTEFFSFWKIKNRCEIAVNFLWLWIVSLVNFDVHSFTELQWTNGHQKYQMRVLENSKNGFNVPVLNNWKIEEYWRETSTYLSSSGGTTGSYWAPFNHWVSMTERISKVSDGGVFIGRKRTGRTASEFFLKIQK
jgi:hypothetical protein